MLYNLFLNVLHSPEKVKFFIQILDNAFLQLFGAVFFACFIVFISLFTYKALKTTKINGANKQLTTSESKSILKEVCEKHKKLIKSLRYLAIGLFLYCFNWKLVSFIFTLLSSDASLSTLGTKSADPALNQLFGNWSLFTLLIFSFAPFFIAFCFGNKFVRNIGILTYILGFLFVFLGCFLNLGLYN